MARVIRFVDKKVVFDVIAPGAGVNTSEIFDVSDAVTIDVELRVFAISGASASVTASVQTTSDSAFTDTNSWKVVGSIPALTTTGVQSATISGLGNFARVNFALAAGTYATVGVNGVVRDTR